MKKNITPFQGFNFMATLEIILKFITLNIPTGNVIRDVRENKRNWGKSPLISTYQLVLQQHSDRKTFKNTNCVTNGCSLPLQGTYWTVEIYGHMVSVFDLNHLQWTQSLDYIICTLLQPTFSFFGHKVSSHCLRPMIRVTRHQFSVSVRHATKSNMPLYTT